MTEIKYSFRLLAIGTGILIMGQPQLIEVKLDIIIGVLYITMKVRSCIKFIIMRMKGK